MGIEIKYKACFKCESCGAKLTVCSKTQTGYPEGEIFKRAKDAGWEFDLDYVAGCGNVLCPVCFELQEYNKGRNNEMP